MPARFLTRYRAATVNGAVAPIFSQLPAAGWRKTCGSFDEFAKGRNCSFLQIDLVAAEMRVFGEASDTY
jgi:hypothetical protein